MDTHNNLPFKANEVISILQTAPDILARNEASVSACTNAGKTLLDTIEGNGGIGTRIPCEVKEDRREHEQPPEAVNPNANGHIQTFHDTRGFHRRQIQGNHPLSATDGA